MTGAPCVDCRGPEGVYDGRCRECFDRRYPPAPSRVCARGATEPTEETSRSTTRQGSPSPSTSSHTGDELGEKRQLLADGRAGLVAAVSIPLALPARTPPVAAAVAKDIYWRYG